MSQIRCEDLLTPSVRAGRETDPVTGAVTTPIYQSTTFAQEKVGREEKYSYSRSHNPTVTVLEKALGELEGGEPALCFSTGMAALTSLCLALLKQGDRVVATDVVYGGSYRLLKQVLGPFGVNSVFADTADTGLLAEALKTPTRLLLLESPANPTLKLADLQACIELAHKAGALVVVDNTLAGPCLQRPLDLGADLVLYSTTKYMDGHNATVGGALIGKDGDLLQELYLAREAHGTIQSPFNGWLTLQGLLTLPLRTAQQCGSALTIARWLESHPGVKAVHYPGLESFPQFELAKRQQSAGGALIACELHGGLDTGAALMESTRLWTLAENLGAAQSLVTHPATMTHAAIPAEVRRRAGIADGLVRLSVGLEHPDDLIRDLQQALELASERGAA